MSVLPKKARRTEYSIRLAVRLVFLKKLLGCYRIRSRRQSRLVARRRILVQGAILYGLVDRRNRPRQKFLDLLGVAGADGPA